jgi:hypothetical protein
MVRYLKISNQFLKNDSLNLLKVISTKFELEVWIDFKYNNDSRDHNVNIHNLNQNWIQIDQIVNLNIFKL